MGELAGALWLLVLLVLMIGFCLSAIVGLGALVGLVDGQYFYVIFGFTWRLWLWWLGAMFIGLGISYYNGLKYTAASRG